MYLWIRRLTLLLLLLKTSFAQATDPSQNWKTLGTEHFNVHYLDSYLIQAKRSAVIAENLYLELEKKLAWSPADKISIVLTDEYDQANGSATPVPFNKMILRLSPPDKVGQLEDYDDWLALLIEHELVHIFHLDKSTGKVSTLRNIFGRYILLFPNIFQPSWFIEGLATFDETHKGIGRGQSGSFEMLMREEVKSGILPVETVNLPPDSQPLNKHYLYGVYFFQFLKEAYGERSINTMISNYSDNLIPFSINSNSEDVFGKDIAQLWKEFEAYLNKRFSKQIVALNKSNEKDSVVIVGRPHNLSAIEFSSDNSMIYIEDNREAPSRLMMRKNSQIKSLIEINRGSTFDVGFENQIYIAQPEYCDEYHLYYDLYRFDLVSGSIKKLTECARYKQISVSRLNNTLAAVKTVNSIPQIDLLDNNAKLIKTLWSGSYGDVIANIDWSEKRNRLLITKKELNKSWGIYEFDLQTLLWSEVVVDHGMFMQGQYTTDEDAVLFTSDISGVFNVYIKPFSATSYSPLTNVQSGAFSPKQHNGKLFYQKFERDGYTIHSTDMKISQITQIKNDLPLSVRFDENITGGLQRYEIKDYSPLPDLKPKYWFPWLVVQNNASEIGFITSSNDSLNHHAYELNLAYGYDQSDLTGSLFYQYENWLSFVLSKENSVYSNLSTGLTDLIRTNKQWQVRFTLPVTKIKDRWRFNLGFIDNQEKDTYLASAVTGFQDQADGLVGASIYYDSKQSFMKGNSPETGRDVLLVAESSDILDSDYSGTATTLDWREYFRLGSHYTIALRYVAGSADPTMRAYNLGGLKSDWDRVTLLDTQYTRTVFNKRNYSLRGYAENTQAGNNIEIGTIEWRFPLLQVEKGIMAPPLGIMKHSGRLFAESGSSWFDNQQQKSLRSIGAEWIIDLNVFYRFTPQIRLGYAEGLDDGGDEIYYLKVGGSF